MAWVLLYYIHTNEQQVTQMYKVNYHYEVNGEAKSFVSDVFMTVEAAQEHILDAFDRNVESHNEHEDTNLDEGYLAEIHREVIERNYSIEYVKDL